MSHLSIYPLASLPWSRLTRTALMLVQIGYWPRQYSMVVWRIVRYFSASFHHSIQIIVAVFQSHSNGTKYGGLWKRLAWCWAADTVRVICVQCCAVLCTMQISIDVKRCEYIFHLSLCPFVQEKEIKLRNVYRVSFSVFIFLYLFLPLLAVHTRHICNCKVKYVCGRWRDRDAFATLYTETYLLANG